MMKQTKTKTYLWARVLFVYYLLLLVWLVLFKLDFSIPYRPRSINLIPFFYQTEGVVNWRVPVREAFANLLAFLPMGLYLGILKVRARWTILIAAAVSLLFEATQFAFSMGVTDITDLITNTLGAACGLLLYRLLCRLIENTERLDRGVLVVGAIGTALAVVYFLVLLVIDMLLFGLLSVFLGGGAG